MTVEVEPLQSALGARVHGVDLAAPVAPATCDAIHAAWMEHLVLVFPGQQLTDEQLVEDFARFKKVRAVCQATWRSLPGAAAVQNSPPDASELASSPGRSASRCWPSPRTSSRPRSA